MPTIIPCYNSLQHHKDICALVIPIRQRDLKHHHSEGGAIELAYNELQTAAQLVWYIV